ncbi:MAG: helix-turn-helix transcriptional regulator [Patescibacteria group bacterium]|nr:helix-turn-helix transcriptional regulator [Patescibacteria group bacterium]
MRSEKIKKALERGELVPRKKVLERYSEEEIEEIKEGARYLKAAIQLREARKAARMSQEKLAKKMRVKREFISRAESGRQNLTLDTLYKFGEAMGKELSWSFK